MEGPAGSWSISRSLSSQIVEHSDLARLLDTSHLINWNQLAQGLSMRFSGMSQTGLDGAVAPDCPRHGATLSKAYLNIALLPSKCNPNPHFYPWKRGGEFICVYGVRKCSNFIILHVAVQFSQNYLLKRLSLPHCTFLPTLSKIRYP